MIDAMKQALEALETCGEDEWYTDDNYGMVQTYDEEKVRQAIVALRLAIEQAEKQEPVAWMDEYGDVLSASIVDGKGLRNIPLYAAPPQRQLNIECQRCGRYIADV